MKRPSSTLTPPFTPPTTPDNSENHIDKKPHIDTSLTPSPLTTRNLNTEYSFISQNTADPIAKELHRDTSLTISTTPLITRSLNTSNTPTEPINLFTFINYHQDLAHEIIKHLPYNKEFLELRTLSKFFQFLIETSNRFVFKLTVDNLLSFNPTYSFYLYLLRLEILNAQTSSLNMPTLYPHIKLKLSDIECYVSESEYYTGKYSKNDFQKLDKELQTLPNLFENPFFTKYTFPRITSLHLDFFVQLSKQLDSFITLICENSHLFPNLLTCSFNSMHNLAILKFFQSSIPNPESYEFNLPKLPNSITTLYLNTITSCLFKINEFSNNLTFLQLDYLHDTKIYLCQLPYNLQFLYLGNTGYLRSWIHSNNEDINNSFYITDNQENDKKIFFQLPPLPQNLIQLYLPNLIENYYTLNENRNITLNFPQTLPETLKYIFMKHIFKISTLPKTLPQNLKIDIKVIDEESKKDLEALNT